MMIGTQKARRGNGSLTTGVLAAVHLSPLTHPSSGLPTGTTDIRHQPTTTEQQRRAEMAAVVCPTKSIRTASGQTWQRHHPVHLTDDVWRVGDNSPDTFGGNAFLIRRQDGNLLVDSPKWTARLAEAVADLGGIDHVLLTHRDDVGDAEQFADHFDSAVWIHQRDLDAAPFAAEVPTGTGPTQVVDGILAIPTPGHTAGHVMYLVDDATLLTGDSLSWVPERDGLWAEEGVCWHSWPQQLASLRRLLDHQFVRVLPTHGIPSPTLKVDVMHDRLRQLLAELAA